MRTRIDLNKVSFFCVADKNYLDPAYVTLNSYFDYNTHPVTLYVFDTDEEDLVRFKKFDKLTIVKLDSISFPHKPSYDYYKYTINFISAKIRIFDLLKGSYDYALCFDIDTIFKGTIEDLFDDFDDSGDFYGVQELWLEVVPSECRGYRSLPYFNVGLIVVKLDYQDKLIDEYISFLNKYHTSYPEQDFLNYYFKNRIEIPVKYNWLINNYDLIDDIRFVHFCSVNKPFNMYRIELNALIMHRFKYITMFEYYYNYIKDLELSDKFLNACAKMDKRINLLRSMHKRIEDETKSQIQ